MFLKLLNEAYINCVFFKLYLLLFYVDNTNLAIDYGGTGGRQ